MVKLIDSDTGDEYEETEEDILSRERYYAKLAETQQEYGLPQYTYGQGIDGHKYRYNVIGRYDDGSLRTSSFDAVHMDTCHCPNSPNYDPEKWY